MKAPTPSQTPRADGAGFGPAEKREGGRRKLQFAKLPIGTTERDLQLKKSFMSEKRLQMTLSTAIH